MGPKKRKASPSQTRSEGATRRMKMKRSNGDNGDNRDFDVFLNFRGPDSRETVADVLHHTLAQAGVRVFQDDESIRKGELIEGELLSAINNSRIYIPIFSKRYASSKWCLRELEEIVKFKKNSSDEAKKEILPVFHEVNVSKDVKLRSQVYTRALSKHKKELGEAVVKRWEDALKYTAQIKGWNLKEHGLSKLADLIKQKVFSILYTREAVPVVPNHLIGMDDQIEAIIHMLDEQSINTRFIVIHGMSGIGKTTLADSVFRKISSHFQGSCMLSDISRWSSDNDMVKLQEKLLQETLKGEFIKVSDIQGGIHMISKRLCSLKVLIILDGVDERDHIKNLAAHPSWFGSKSRIIITTCNIDVLPIDDSDDYCRYEMQPMDGRHALQLFCRSAFENDFPPPNFHDISTKIVATTGGLPLAIKVIGSSLYKKGEETWEFRLEKLLQAPYRDVTKKLMISYEALEYEQRQIFLDIACFFNNKKKIDPIYFWEACKLFPSSGIEILVYKSLIKVNDHDELLMHDQLRHLGRAISQSRSPILTELRRLWSPEVALAVVRRKEVAESIVALELGTLDANCGFIREEFAGSINLKLLQLQGGNFKGDFKNVLHQLRWLSWFNCPMIIEATNLSFENLVVLKLSGSQIVDDWVGWSQIMVAKHLKVLNLISCTCLKKTPDFSALLELKRLILKFCWQLEKTDKSITELQHLEYLKISNGYQIDSRNFDGYEHHFGENLQLMPPRPQLLQDSIGGMQSLTVLKINNAGLTKLDCSIGKLAKLKHLRLRCPQLGNLPSSIGQLKSLEELDISFSGIKSLPDSIGYLKKLNILKMVKSAMLCLPNSIETLESLNELQLSGTKIIALPETIGSLKRLKVIYMSSSSMRELPEALGDLENLEELHASQCIHMDGELPTKIGNLSCLRILKLSNTKVSKVPTTIKHLSHLQELVLGEFYKPQKLPKLPTSLTTLEVSFSSMKSHRVPNLSNMTNLVTLKLFGGTNNNSSRTSQSHVQTPNFKWLVRLAKMEKLTLVLSDLILPQTDLSSLSRLQMLDITCFNPQSLTHLPSSLESLTLRDVKSQSEWQLFSGLSNLSTLKLHTCWYTEIKVNDLGQLKNLHLCTLKLVDCVFIKGLFNLSCLKELRKLEIENCPDLVSIQGLGEVEFLRSLSMLSCGSIKGLPDLSSLKKLEELRFKRCDSLETIPNVDEEASCYLEVSSCRHLEDFQGRYTEQNKRENDYTED